MINNMSVTSNLLTRTIDIVKLNHKRDKALIFVFKSMAWKLMYE